MVKSNKDKIYRVPDRTVPHRPAKSTRRYLYDNGVGKVTPHPQQVEDFDKALPELLRKSITLFLHEHCVFGEDDYLWISLQKGNLNEAIGIAADKVATHKERINELFSAAGGGAWTTAYLVTADYWNEIVTSLLGHLHMEKHYDKLTTKIRPRGGMPMYDESMIRLAEIVERGDWEY